MSGSGQYPITGEAEVGEMVVGGQEEGVRGRQDKPKRPVVVAIEKKEERGG